MGAIAGKSKRPPAYGAFAKAMVERRKERGFHSAYAFFHKSGGRKLFGFEYKYYLLLEKGHRLPNRATIRRILETLGMNHPGFVHERRLLVQSYFRALVDGDPYFDVAFEGTAGPSERQEWEGEAESRFFTAAAVQQVSAVPRMSADQADLVCADEKRFWVEQWLLQTGGKQSPTTIARALGYPEADVASALHVLASAGLAREETAGAFSSPHAESDLFFPVSAFLEKAPWIASQIEKRHRAGDAGAAGRPSDRYYAYILMPVEDDARMALLHQLMRDVIRKAYLLRPRGGPRRGRLVAVEAQVRPLIPFGETPV